MNVSQPSHPDPLLLDAYVDGTAAGNELQIVGEHIERCAECAEYVQRVRLLADELRALPTMARRIPPIAGDVAGRVAARTHGAGWRIASPLMAAAAAAVIFGAGVAVGSAARRPPEAASPPPTDLRPALDVQQAGTSFIAALVRLNASGGGNDVRAVHGREVALATLYGAAAEAVAPLGADAEASELLELARAMRDRVARSSPLERVP